MRRFIPYRNSSRSRARRLRKDATTAERKLWREFLHDLPEKFTRQKPLGFYIVDFYCSSKRLAIEVDGDSHFNDAGERYDARRTAALKTNPPFAFGSRPLVRGGPCYQNR